MLDDTYLWTTNADAEATILDGDNEVLDTNGALICSDCQVLNAQLQQGRRLQCGKTTFRQIV